MKYFLITLPISFLILFLCIIFPETESPNIVKFLIISQVMFILYLVLLYLVKKYSFSFCKHRNLFIYFIIIGIIIRFSVSFFSGEVSYLSDDVYRYIWEGKLVAHHYNPYLISPNEMADTPLADSTIYPKINHPWHVTIYPPVSQYIFAASYLLGGDSLVGFKLLSLLFELFSLFLIFQFVRKYKLPDWSFLIYLFSPFIITEFLFSNHLDSFGLPFLLGTLILLKDHKKHIYSISILIVLAVLVKLYMLFFIPFIFMYLGKTERIKFLITFILMTILLYLPFLTNFDLSVFGSLFVYLGTWQYNGSLFLIFKNLFTEDIARYISIGIFISAYIPLLMLKRFKHNIMLQSFIIFGLYILVTPAIFNWYLLWIIPFILYYRNIAFLILTGTSMLSYHVLIGYYSGGSWSSMPVLALVNYLPFYAILLYEIYKSYKQPKVTTS